MNVLITGGTGFIGEYFVPELIKAGHRVRLLVRNIDKAKKLFQDSCEYFVGDVTCIKELTGCCDGIDIVYHMVAKVGNELPSDENFSAFRAVNVDGTNNIIKQCISSGVSRFVFVSSIAAMGIVKENLISEKSECQPYLPYQVTKYEAENLVLKYVKEGFPGIIVRPTKVYGAGEHEYSYMTLVKLCKKGIFIKIGKGKNYTSNIYVTDLVQALVNLTEKGKIGETYILTSEDSIAFDDVGKVISQVLDKRIICIPISAKLMIMLASIEEKIFWALKKKPIVTKRNIEATITDRVYDISKAKEQIGFVPQMTMEEGIRKTVTWYKENQLL